MCLQAYLRRMELGLIDGKQQLWRRFKSGVVGLCQSIVTCSDLDLEKIFFFEDGLPPPALHNMTGFTDDADEPLRQTRPVERVSPQIIPTQAC